MRQRFTNMINVRFDKQRMVVKRAQLLDSRRSWSNCRLRVGDVFEILAATGVRAIRRGPKRQRVSNSVIGHLSQRVRQQRMPVAIAPVDGQSWSIRLQLVFESGD